MARKSKLVLAKEDLEKQKAIFEEAKEAESKASEALEADEENEELKAEYDEKADALALAEKAFDDAEDEVKKLEDEEAKKAAKSKAKTETKETASSPAKNGKMRKIKIIRGMLGDSGPGKIVEVDEKTFANLKVNRILTFEEVK